MIRLLTRSNSKYVVSQNYVWEVSEAQYAKITDEIKQMRLRRRAESGA